MTPAWMKNRTTLLYGLFAAAAFLLALRWTFPSEAVKERLIYEAGAAGWQIDVQEVRPGGVLGVRMEGVTLTDAAGLKMPVDELDAALRVLPLLVGKRTLDFRAALYGGTVEGEADLSGATRDLAIRVEGVNLMPILPLRKASGIDFVGVVNGSVELTYPSANPEKATGTIDLAIEKGGVAGGTVPVSGFQEGFTLFPIALGTVRAAGTAKDGVLDLSRLGASGGDVELQGEAVKVMLQPRLAYSPIGGRARIRFQPALWQKPAASSRKPVFEAMMMNARTPDGAYQYQLFGSLALPRLAAAPSGGGAPPNLPPPGGPPVPGR
ncbi:MAG TPA: type II secretion system protein GspN [Anaeromyxobacter sp.]|nr:type II secretion system protein GspN [Anaeromyxobacter sp.]